MSRILLLGVGALWVAVLGATVVSAQDDPWEWDIEVGGSVFFGEVDQTTLTTGVSVERADSAYELSARLGFDYGETSDPETGTSVVSRRSWLATTSVDWAPMSQWSPFAFGTGERSFEKRIDFRYNAGLGLKHTFWERTGSRIDLSGGLLGEQTLVKDAAEDSPSNAVLARFSFRFRIRHRFGDERILFDTRNYYEPEVGRIGNATFRSLNSLDYRLTEVFALGINFDYDYDSLSRDRGARSNDTGKVFLSLKATF